MTKHDATYDGWTIIELMGHRKLAGMVKEVTIAGAGFLRLDVPDRDGVIIATQFYPPSSVYCLTPTTEEIARAFAAHNMPQPVSRYELPAPVGPIARSYPDYPDGFDPYDEDEDDDDDDDDTAAQHPF